MHGADTLRRGGLLALLLVFFSSTAFAQVRSVSLSSSDATGSPGDQVVVTVDGSDWIGVSELQVIKLALGFDPLLLDVVDVAPGVALAGWPAADVTASAVDGVLTINGLTETPVAVTDGTLFAITFEVREGVFDGATTPLDLIGVTDGNPILLQTDVADDATRVKVATDDGTFTAQSVLVCTPGDALADGETNAADAVVVLRIVVDLAGELTALDRCNADANGNGVVDAGDAVVVLRRVVGLERAYVPSALDVRVRRNASGAVLVIDDAASVYGLSIVADGTVTTTGVSAGALGVQSDVDGRTHVAYAAAAALGRDAIEIALAADVVPTEALRLYGADGAEIDVRFVEDRSVVSSRAGLLLSNAPNPFNPSTTISYELPAAGRARLELFNARGERVVALLDGNLPAGPGRVVWNGTDANGRTVASGVYFAQLSTENGGVARQRLVLLK